MRYIYLGSPYSDPDPEVRESRYWANMHAFEYLSRQGEIVFSPIVHCHLSACKDDGLPTGWSFWQTFDECFLLHARELRGLMLAGWQASVGLTAEIDLCRRHLIPISYMEPLP